MIHLTQYLCENRHCIVAVAWDDTGEGSNTRESIEQIIKDGVKDMGVNPWCGLCGSTKLHFETGQTKFASRAAAEGALKRCEADQAVTRALYGLSPKLN